MPWGWKALGLLAALVFMGLGAIALIQKQHVGSTRHSAEFVVLQGSSAEAMGWTLIVMGLLPLVVWVPSRIWAARFAVGWFFALMAVIFIPLALL